MWDASTNLQLLNFLRSAIFGTVIAVFYDLLKGIRLSRHNSVFSTLLLDLLFFVIITPVLFCFLVATTNGMLRGYILIGILVGFFLYRFTISKFIFKIYFLILKKVFKFFTRLNKLINKFFDIIYVIILKIAKFLLEIIKKSLNSVKKVLKK